MSREQGGVGVAERLRERRPEIEQAILTRVYSVSEAPRRGGPEYAEGLRRAVSAAVAYGLAGIERGEQGAPPIPDALLAQARLAARSGVSLDTVLRRYFAGHTLLEDFMVEEAEGETLLEPAELKRLLRSQAAIVDRLLAAVSKAYTEEAGRRPEGTERRRAERIERLLTGEPLDVGDFGYGFAGWHLGLIALGPDAPNTIVTLARSLDARPLTVRRDDGALWAWLGSRRRLDPAELGRLLPEPPADLTLASGEPGEGLASWRLTHRQALAALSVAVCSGERIVRYGDVALLAAILQDELLAASLRELYLEPLAQERGGGEISRRTLRIYIATQCNVSSTAANLGVNRKTVTSRLRAVERRLGRPIAACAAELEAALRLHELAEPAADPLTPSTEARFATPH